MHLCQISHWFHVSIGSFVVVPGKNKNLHYLSDLVIFCSQPSQKNVPCTKKGLKNFDWPCHFPPGFPCVCVCVCSCSFRKVLGNFTLLLTFPFVPPHAVDPLDVVLQKNNPKRRNIYIVSWFQVPVIFQPWALLQPNPVDASEIQRENKPI